MLDLFIMLVFSMYMYMIVHVVHLNEGPPGKREGEGGGEAVQNLKPRCFIFGIIIYIII